IKEQLMPSRKINPTNSKNLLGEADRKISKTGPTQRRLLENFDRWSLANKYGWTAAHEAAVAGRLPEDFDQWHLADKYGWTVAHVAARYGCLPKKFDQWDLADKDGKTVAHIAVKYGYIS
ncbi:MAG: hypothetical protein CUN55_20520, partial [Phototrophicales bacterium]